VTALQKQGPIGWSRPCLPSFYAPPSFHGEGSLLTGGAEAQLKRFNLIDAESAPRIHRRPPSC